MFRYLARWEKMQCDWDGIIAELSQCPFLVKTETTPEKVILELRINGDILSWPGMGGALTNCDLDVLEAVNKHKKELGLPPLPRHTHIVWGSHSHMGHRHDYTVYLRIWVDEYCAATNRSCEIVRNDFIPATAPQTKQCWIWSHDWELFRDFVRSNGWHTGWFSSGGIQKAIFRCKKCGKEALYWREGEVGLFTGGSTRWMRCGKRQEEEIDELPRL